MSAFKDFDLPQLYDMIASQTTKYTHMLSSGEVNEEFDKCRETILQLQSEIEARKTRTGIPVTGTDEATLAFE